MKYFEKIPKINYQTTLGSFRVSYPYSYYEFNYDSLRTQDYNADNKKTLLESSAIIYGDANAFWLLLLSNKSINPFSLFPKNFENYKKQEEEKYSFRLGDESVFAVTDIKPQSILAGQTADTGQNISNFSGTGGFNINGNFTIIESIDTYNKKVKIKKIKIGDENDWNITENSTDNIKLFKFEKNLGYLTSTDTFNSTDKFLSKDEIKISEIKDDGEKYVGGSLISFKSEGIGALGPEEYSQLSEEEILKISSKSIKAFIPDDINKVIGSLVTIKYF